MSKLSDSDAESLSDVLSSSHHRPKAVSSPSPVIALKKPTAWRDVNPLDFYYSEHVTADAVEFECVEVVDDDGNALWCSFVRPIGKKG